MHAAVAAEAYDVVIEEGVFGGIEAGFSHFGGDGHADGVADALAEGAGGAFDAWGFDGFWMAGGVAMEFSKIFNFLKIQVVAA